MAKAMEETKQEKVRGWESGAWVRVPWGSGVHEEERWEEQRRACKQV